MPIVAAIGLSFGVIGQIGNTAPQEHQLISQTSQYQEGSNSALTAIGKRHQRWLDKHNARSNEQATYYDVENLKQQTRSADAAWAQAKAAFAQNWIIGIEALLLACTLAATAWASIAASRAAKVAERAMTVLERPYIFFKDIVFKKRTELPGQSASTTFQVLFHNSGKMPAIITGIQVKADLFNVPPVSKNLELKNIPSGAIVDAGADWEREIVSALSTWPKRKNQGASAAYMYGRVRYKELGGAERFTWFCRIWNGKKFILADLTDPNLNGHD